MSTGSNGRITDLLRVQFKTELGTGLIQLLIQYLPCDKGKHGKYISQQKTFSLCHLIADVPDTKLGMQGLCKVSEYTSGVDNFLV